jgi:hypothetical protein
MRRSLLPREHGAYVQLLAPLATSFAVFGASLASISITIAACFAFAAYEPLLVLRGHRGKRAFAIDADRARIRLVVLVVAAAIAAGVGFILAPFALPVAAAVAAPGALLVALAIRKRTHSLAGEIVAAIALSGAAAPVAIAAGGSERDGLLLWLAWALGYAFTVVAVHRVIARHRRSASVIDAVLAIAALVTFIICSIAVAHFYVALPLVGCVFVLAIVAPSATRLRTIGFALLGASIVSTAVGVLAI